MNQSVSLVRTSSRVDGDTSLISAILVPLKATTEYFAVEVIQFIKALYHDEQWETYGHSLWTQIYLAIYKPNVSLEVHRCSRMLKKHNIGTVDGTPAVPEILKKPPAVRHGKGESEKAGARGQRTEGRNVRSRRSKSSTQQEERRHGLFFVPPPPASSGSMTDL